MKRADKSRARFALILGEQEIKDRSAGLKPLRSDDEQASIPRTELAGTLAGKIGKPLAAGRGED